MFEAFMHDARYAVRWLRRSPGFTVIAVLSLGFGIGLNSAIFSVADALLLRPLPVAAPAQLVNVYSRGTDQLEFSTHSVPDFDDYRVQNTVFEDMAAHSMMIAAVGRGRPRLTLGESVSGNYFRVLGVKPRLGRLLEAADGDAGAPRVVAISSRYWHREFGGDRNVIGQTLYIRSQPYTIVGVADDQFTGMVPLLAAEIWTTLRYIDDAEPAGINEVVPSPGGTSRLDRRGTRWLFVKGRLKPGVSIEQASANIDAIAARLRDTHPQTNRDRYARLRAVTATRIHPDADATLTWMVTGTMVAVGLVLAIACANVAGMLLARASARHREMAIRLAIGAGRVRLIRQLLTESFLLGASGALVGLVLASWVSRMLATFELPIPIPLSLDVRMDVRVVAFTSAVALLTGLIAGLAPALRSSRASVVGDLKEAAGQSRRRWFRWTMRDALVVTQMAVTFVLLVTAAMLVRSLAASSTAEVGFPSTGLAIVSGDVSMAGYDAERGRAFWTDVDRRVRALPGVEAVAFASRVPFSFNFSFSTIAVPGHVKANDQMGVQVSSANVSPEYFATLGVSVLEGRDFSAADHPDGPPVAIVSRTMAQRFWPNDTALGKRVFERTLNSGRSFEIVGVVADHKLQTVGETTPPAIFFSASQRPDTYNVVLARTRGDAGALVRDVVRMLSELEPGMPLFEQQTMQMQVASTLLPLRIGVALVGIFSTFGLLLAAVGLYGVLAFSVARRTREIGIRMAIGARPASVLALVTRQGMTLAVFGLVAGALIATVTARVVSGVLYGVSAADVLSWIGAIAVLLLIAGVANVFPAIRAMRINPVQALRTE